MKKIMALLVALMIPISACFADDDKGDQIALNLADILDAIYYTDYSNRSYDNFLDSIEGMYFCEYSNITRVYNGEISIEKLFDLYANQVPLKGYIFLLIVDDTHYFTLSGANRNIIKVLRANDIVTTNKLYQDLMAYLTPRIAELGIDSLYLRWFAFLAQKESDKAIAVSSFYDKIAKTAVLYDADAEFRINTWYYPIGM